MPPQWVATERTLWDMPRRYRPLRTSAPAVQPRCGAGGLVVGAHRRPAARRGCLSSHRHYVTSDRAEGFKAAL